MFGKNANNGLSSIVDKGLIKRFDQENKALRLLNAQQTQELDDLRTKLKESIVREYELTEAIEKYEKQKNLRLLEAQNKRLKEMILKLREELAAERNRLDILTVNMQKRYK